MKKYDDLCLESKVKILKWERDKNIDYLLQFSIFSFVGAIFLLISRYGSEDVILRAVNNLAYLSGGFAFFWSVLAVVKIFVFKKFYKGLK